MKSGDRVALATDPTWLGTCASDEDETGAVTIEGDGGWKGRLHVETLSLVEAVA